MLTRNGKLIRYSLYEWRKRQLKNRLHWIIYLVLIWQEASLHPINSCGPITKTTISIYWHDCEKYPNQIFFFFFFNKRHFMQLFVNNRHRLEGKSQKLSQQFFFLYLLLPFSCFCLTAIRSFSSLQQLHGSSTPKSQCRIRQLKAMPELHRADETSCKLFLQHWVASKN